MTARAKPTTSTVDALQVEYRQLHARVAVLASRCRDPNDPRLAKLRQLESGIVLELKLLGAEPDKGGAK